MAMEKSLIEFLRPQYLAGGAITATGELLLARKNLGTKLDVPRFISGRNFPCPLPGRELTWVPDFVRQEDTPMAADENIQLMRRWFQEVWNEGRIQTVYELLSPDAVATGQRGAEKEIRGPEEFVKFVREIRGAFPDIKVNVEDVFGAGDKVVLRWSAVMTHTGDALGLPASGQTVRSRGITIARIVDGKIVEGWDNWDQLGMLEQIGVYKQPLAA
jgi:steroid delta-isomerase-like uncharacterized protein